MKTRIGWTLAATALLAGCSSDLPELERIAAQLQAEVSASSADVKAAPPAAAEPAPSPEQARARLAAAIPASTVELSEESSSQAAFRLTGRAPPPEAIAALHAAARAVPAVTLRTLSMAPAAWKAELELARADCCEAGATGAGAAPRRTPRALPAEGMLPSVRSRQLRAKIAKLEAELEMIDRMRAAQGKGARPAGRPLAEELLPFELLFAGDRPVFSEGDVRGTEEGAQVAGTLAPGRTADDFRAVVSARFDVVEEAPGELVRAVLKRRTSP